MLKAYCLASNAQQYEEITKTLCTNIIWISEWRFETRWHLYLWILKILVCITRDLFKGTFFFGTESTNNWLHCIMEISIVRGMCFMRIRSFYDSHNWHNNWKICYTIEICMYLRLIVCKEILYSISWTPARFAVQYRHFFAMH